ncbi:MAG: molybdopterin-guanine dinucleotide biosynthesis protein B [Firmicutes bacterium]|nr:molybdopterin-guanine dinucleotide biosynthesis protein B [Bacillota bacterium]
MDGRRAIRVGILTASDKGSAGGREDRSGPVIRELLGPLGADVVRYELVPDERELIRDKLREMADTLDLDVVVTTGGTGLSPRDITPEATLDVIERQVPGIPEAMRSAGLKKTGRAMLSRGVAGVRGRTLIINLPGSPRAVRENLDAILAELPHAIGILRGTTGECARSEEAPSGIAIGPKAEGRAPMVCVVGRSNSGKTTLIEKLLPDLKNRGLRVGTIKHDAHSFDMDHPGKDTWRHAQAGADAVLISSATKLALIRKMDGEAGLDELAGMLTGVDLILAEGYKRSSRPKVEVVAPPSGISAWPTAMDRPGLLCGPDDNLVAVVSDYPVEAGGAPRFSWDQVNSLSLFLVRTFLGGGKPDFGETSFPVQG